MEDKIEELFENKSLTELKAVERKFHSDIERKRQDLRLLVGERYKDVIDVSDKLTGITNHSSQIKLKLERMQSLCESLKSNYHHRHQKSSQGVETNVVYQSDRQQSSVSVNCAVANQKSSSHNLSKQLTLACQLKLLSVMPENVLLFLDSCEYVKASQLVNVADKLKIHLVGPVSEERDLIQKKFPIINRISTNQMKATVKQCLNQNVVNLCKQVNEQTTTAAVYTKETKMEEMSSGGVVDVEKFDGSKVELFNEIVRAFSIVNNASSSIVESVVGCIELVGDYLIDIVSNDCTTQSVDSVLSNVCRVCYFTTYCVSSLLAANGLAHVKDGHVVSTPSEGGQLNVDRHCSKLFDDLYPNHTDLKPFLPQNILNEFSVHKLTSSAAAAECENWDLDKFKREVGACLDEVFVNKLKSYVEKSQLKYVKNIRSLTNIKFSLMHIENVAYNWVKAEVLEKLGFELDLWKKLFEPIFTSSLKKLIEESAVHEWDMLAQILTERIVPLFSQELSPLNKSKTGKYEMPPTTNSNNTNIDMPCYLWSEDFTSSFHHSSSNSPQKWQNAAANAQSQKSHLASNVSNSPSTETPALIGVCRKLDDIVDNLCETSGNFFRIKDTNSDSATATSSLSSYDLNQLTFASGHQRQSFAANNSQASGMNEERKQQQSEIARQITMILIKKLIDFLQFNFDEIKQKEDAKYANNLAGVEVRLRLLNYVFSNARCVQHLQRFQSDDPSLEAIFSFLSQTQQEWVDILCEEAMSCLFPSLLFEEVCLKRKDGKEIESSQSQRLDDDLLQQQQQLPTSSSKVAELYSQMMAAACWEQVDLEEETEDGKPIITKLSIPIKASYLVHQMLYVVSSGLNRICPLLSPHHTSSFSQLQQHTIPKQQSGNTSSPSHTKNNSHQFHSLTGIMGYERISSMLMLRLNENIVDFYKNKLFSIIDEGSQNQQHKSKQDSTTKLIIQIIYDIKILSALIHVPSAPSEEDRHHYLFTSSSISDSFNTKSSYEQVVVHDGDKLPPPPYQEKNGAVPIDSVLDLYEQKVDPFDYDVYSQYISQKINQEISQSQHLYGYILNSPFSSSSVKLTSAPPPSVSNTSSTTSYHNLCQLVGSLAPPIKFQPLSVPSSAAAFGFKRQHHNNAAAVNKSSSSSSLNNSNSSKHTTGQSTSLQSNLWSSFNNEKTAATSSYLKGWFPSTKTN